jgi:hypothetical protein
MKFSKRGKTRIKIPATNDTRGESAINIQRQPGRFVCQENRRCVRGNYSRAVYSLGALENARLQPWLTQTPQSIRSKACYHTHPFHRVNIERCRSRTLATSLTLRRPCSRSGKQRPKALKETIRKLVTQAAQAGFSSTRESHSISIRRLSGHQGFQASHPGREWTSGQRPSIA